MVVGVGSAGGYFLASVARNHGASPPARYAGVVGSRNPLASRHGGRGERDNRSLGRVAVVLPDSVELVLVVEPVEAEHEHEDQADPAVTRRLSAGGPLHQVHAATCPED